MSVGGHRACVALLVGLCALSLFAALGSTPLWEPDEPRFAGATREMVRSGNYLDPVFNGRPRWEKPILLYWLQAPSLRLGLDDELAMRLPAAVLGTVAVVCVYALGAIWWTPTAGLVAAALLATTFRFVTYARQGLTDIPATAGIVATFLAFEVALSPERSPRARLAWWIGWTIVGLTALTKGPLAVVAPAIWIAATWIRRRETIRWTTIVAGATVAAVVGGSWFVYMAAQRGSAFVGVNNYEFLQRYFDESFPGPERGPLFYIGILPGEIAPWTLVAIAAVIFLIWRRKTFDRRGQDGLFIAAAWFAGVMLICSFSHYKLPHYALPAYPALMLLTGAAIDRALERESASRVVTIGVVLTAFVFVLLGVVSLVAAFGLEGSFAAGAVAIGVASMIGGAGGVILLRRRAGSAVVALAAGTAVAYGAIAILVLPAFAAASYPYPALGRLVAERSPRSVGLASIGAHTALVYYADRPVTFFASPPEAAQFLISAEPRLLVLSRNEFDAVRSVVAATELASRRRQNPRLSRLLQGGLMNPGTEELLAGNPAAAAIYGR